LTFYGQPILGTDMRMEHILLK